MNSAILLARQGHRLLQIGVALLLLTSFEGFAIPYLAVPLVGRSVHTLTALLAVLLLAMGLLWARLDLPKTSARIAFWFLIYSGIAIDAAFLIAAIMGAGQTVMPLSGAHRGTSAQEALITIVAYSSAPTGIVAFVLILWGLRTMPTADRDTAVRDSVQDEERRLHFYERHRPRSDVVDLDDGIAFGDRIVVHTRGYREE